jgi:hypothetical protein
MVHGTALASMVVGGRVVLLLMVVAHRDTGAYNKFEKTIKKRDEKQSKSK